MSNYIEPEMEKIKLEEESLEDASGGVCIGIKREENDGKYCTKVKTDGICIGKDRIDAKVCTKVKTDGNDIDNRIPVEGEACTIKC